MQSKFRKLCRVDFLLEKNVKKNVRTPIYAAGLHLNERTLKITFAKFFRRSLRPPSLDSFPKDHEQENASRGVCYTTCCPLVTKETETETLGSEIPVRKKPPTNL